MKYWPHLVTHLLLNTNKVQAKSDMREAQKTQQVMKLTENTIGN